MCFFYKFAWRCWASIYLQKRHQSQPYNHDEARTLKWGKMMSKQTFITAVFAYMMLCSLLIAKDDGKTPRNNGNNVKKELTLERLFPEKSFFGPSSESTSFSFDGKYAAYLYRSYEERRHGPDLWIFDVDKGKTRRITSVSVMARFQESTRKVKEDRIKKAESEKKGRQENKKKARKEKNNNDSDNKLSEKGKKRNAAKRKKEGDWVSDKDADDEKAPRYSGIESFEWSPEANELLFVSQGDVYQYTVGSGKLMRLTRTREEEKHLAWLPDASGYTFMRGDDLMKVRFRSHLSEQLYVKLPDGERMTQYKISPDGRRMVFLAVKEGPDPGGREQTVNIAQYRDRFMKVKEVPRGVSDDPIREKETAVYACELNQLMEENSALAEIYRYTLTQPRDFVKLPEWSADSKRAVFAVYDQATGIINIMETTWPEKPDRQESKNETKTAKNKDVTEEKNSDKSKDEKNNADKEEKKDEAIEKRPAKVIHRFLHTGGPTTPRMIRPYYLADNRRIVYLSEKSGFRQLHVLDPLYESDIQLTQGHFEVYPIDITKDHKWIFVTATREDPARLDVYRLWLEDGTMTRLSQQDGFHSDVAVSPDGSKVLANFARFGAPRELVFIDTESHEQKQLTDSHPPVAHEMTEPRPEFFSYQNRHGQEIQGFMFKPNDPNECEKRPLLVYIYGGPLGTSKSVVEGYFHSSAYFFAYYMTEKHGYVTCTIDPRGNSGYGGLFEKANFEQVGKPQVEDIVDGVKYFIENHNVDPNRVAIHGWSFGGFQTQMCLYTEPDVFAAGIAGAGPTEWENYNSWYTSGTIGISEPGSAELKKFSLLPLAKGLKARLLLVHGMEDSNVLYQDTVRMYRELIKAGKETLVELFLDPTGGHGLGGDVKNLSRYRKYEDFLLRTIGSGKETNQKLTLSK